MKTKRTVAKIASVFLAGIMILGFAGCKEKKAAIDTTPNPESDFEFILNDDMTKVSITKYKGTRADLVIPETIQGIPVTAIISQETGSYDLMGGYSLKSILDTDIRSLVIPSSVEYIGESAFANTDYPGHTRFLQLIDIKGCTYIGKNAFEGAGRNLKSWDLKELKKFGYLGKLNVTVNFPENLGFIDQEAFYNANIEEVNLEKCKNLKSIKALAFSGSETKQSANYENEAIKKVILPEGLLYIGDGAFEGDKNLSEINFPSTLKMIERNAFRGNSSLTKVTLNEGLEILGENAFRYCTGLKSVSIPSSLKFVRVDRITYDFGQFENCDSLEEIILPDNIDTVKYLMYKNNDTILEYKFRGKSPESLSKIFSGKSIDSSISLQKLLKADIQEATAEEYEAMNTLKKSL